ncbi:MAG: hypothetical protein AMXMBFR7_20530 [Planctomycetota bacterium]
MPEAAAAPDEPAAHARTETAATRNGALFRSAGIVSFMTVVSRVLGLLRDRYLAALFGASWISDAFNLAFILPNLTRRLFGEGALSSAFVPIFSEQLAKEQRPEAFRTASVLMTRLALFLFLGSGLLVAVSMGVLSGLPAERESLRLTLELAAIMLFYCVLANVGAVLMGVLNSLRHFAAPAAAPVLLNLCMIAACWYGLHQGREAPLDERVKLVAWSVMAGGLLQLLVMIPPALARGFKFTPSLNKSDTGYRETMQKFGPVVLGVALFQINILIDQVIARFMIPEDGPVTMLAYGNRLIQLPWAIFSLALATAALPMLSHWWAKEDKPAFAGAVNAAVRNTLFLAVPSAVGLMLLSGELVRLFYGTGAFLANNGEAVSRTGRVVFCFALGLPFYSLNAVLARALYATKDMRSPTIAAAWSVALNVILNVILVQTDLKEAGLALASTISGGFQTLWMTRVLYRRTEAHAAGRLAGFAGTMAFGLAVGGMAAAYVYHRMSANPDYEGFMVFFACAGAGLLPLAFLGFQYFKMRLKEAREAYERERPKDAEADEPPRFGVPDERWPTDLAFFHALYTIAIASAVMGLAVWAVRDSLPPAGNAFALVFQRGIIPVIAGMAVYVFAAQGVQSREYDELKAAFARKTKRKG